MKWYEAVYLGTLYVPIFAVVNSEGFLGSGTDLVCLGPVSNHNESQLIAPLVLELPPGAGTLESWI